MNKLKQPPPKVKIKVKVRAFDVVPLFGKSTSGALRYGTHCQGFSQFYMHTRAFRPIREHYEPCVCAFPADAGPQHNGLSVTKPSLGCGLMLSFTWCCSALHWSRRQARRQCSTAVPMLCPVVTLSSCPVRLSTTSEWLCSHEVTRQRCSRRSVFSIVIIINEYYYGGAVALLLQGHLTMSLSRFAD